MGSRNTKSATRPVATANSVIGNLFNNSFVENEIAKNPYQFIELLSDMNNENANNWDNIWESNNQVKYDFMEKVEKKYGITSELKNYDIVYNKDFNKTVPASERIPIAFYKLNLAHSPNRFPYGYDNIHNIVFNEKEKQQFEQYFLKELPKNPFLLHNYRKNFDIYLNYLPFKTGNNIQSIFNAIKPKDNLFLDNVTLYRNNKESNLSTKDLTTKSYNAALKQYPETKKFIQDLNKNYSKLYQPTVDNTGFYHGIDLSNNKTATNTAKLFINAVKEVNQKGNITDVAYRYKENYMNKNKIFEVESE